MPMTEQERVLLGKLLLAMCCLMTRSNPQVRREVVTLLVRDHADEVVSSFLKQRAA